MTEQTYTPPPLLPNELTDDKPWSAKGRFGRLSYLAWTLVSTIAFYIILFPVAFVFGGFSALAGGSESSFAGLGIGLILAFAVLYIAFIYITIVYGIRRAHDINISGWWLLLFLIPIVNIIFGLYLLFARGTDGQNRFGPPRKTSEWEKILGWIYIALIPISIIFFAVFAIPAYQGYVTKLQETQHSQTIGNQTYTETSTTETTTAYPATPAS
ncbi:DUF805 domain-containing protein [Aquirhabdus parva]|uniref:DUF805 domain-containing protein n=1 Tax=Aquirhabdus parva TaxID=2283318 RepID=A0A345P375_9GAMM|nr:DUF805 domain-containing protein [Aquirhabdus parva]AXI01734.1 DUF805 domain-containing protein [Aquirhabdus parva]